MTQKRVPRIALIDPVHGTGYSRCNRPRAQYREDAELQAYIDDHGVEAARRFARRRFQGVHRAVVVD